MKNDRYFKLKYLGFCMSNLPPEGADVVFDDWVRYAKYKLCKNFNVLMKDPIWEKYTDEELLVEYFALIFETNEEEREKFKANARGVEDDVLDWFDEEEVKDNKKRKESLKEVEDFTFSPEKMGE